MARTVTAPDRPTRRNPDLFGEDLVSLGWEAVGIGLTGFANDRFVKPLASGFIPAGGTAVAQIADAATTAVTAYVAGEAVGLLDRRIGRRVRRGGMLYAVAKAITALVPGFSLSSQFPSFGGLGAPAPKPALNAANGTAAVTRLGVGSMGL